MRLQLALNVDDLDEAIGFCTKMFATEPLKIRERYANFAVADPPLKLMLFEGAGQTGSINHLGVETETATEVVEAEARVTDAGLETTGVDDTVLLRGKDRDLVRWPRFHPMGVVCEERRRRAVCGHSI